MTTTTKRRWVGPASLGAAAIIAAGAFAVSAGFTDTAPMAASFETGTFNIAVDGHDDSVVAYDLAFSATELLPGESATATVEVQNLGSIDTDVHLTDTTITGVGGDSGTAAEFASWLTAEVSTDGGSSWSSPVLLDDLEVDDLMQLAGGTNQDLDIRVNFDAAADNSATGSSVDVAFELRAEPSAR